MLKDYVTIAFRNISRRKLRSWLTIIGIVIGITAVVALIGLGEGLRQAITGQFSFLPDDALTITTQTFGMLPPGTAEHQNPLTKDDRDEISSVRGIEFAVGRLTNFGTIEYNEVQTETMLGSVPPGKDTDRFRRTMNFNIDEGRFFSDSDRYSVIIGANMKDESSWDGRPLRLGDDIEIEGKEFKVVGILEEKGSFVFDNIFVIPEEAHRDLFDRDNNNYDIIVAKMREGEDIDKVISAVERTMRKQRHVDEGEEDFSVESSQATLGQIDTILYGVQIFVALIASISLVVGGIGIMNTMYTSVLERTREIGIMKAIGATKGKIFLIFTIESGFIGTVGGLGGALLGLGLAESVSFIARNALGLELLHATVSPTLFIASLGFSFLLGTFFGITPSMRAMSLQPVKALSYRN